MGNRAVITTQSKKIGIYLHWNGGRDSVEGFLTYCKFKHYCDPAKDDYGWPRLAQIISNFIGGNNSVGLNLYDRLDRDNYDNGVYIISDWRIVGREFHSGPEQQEYDLYEFLVGIDEAQPEKEKLGKEQLRILLDKYQAELSEVK